MPSLMRFLTVLAFIVGAAYAAVWSLATFVEPHPRQMTVVIPRERLNRAPTVPVPAAAPAPAAGEGAAGGDLPIASPTASQP